MVDVVTESAGPGAGDAREMHSAGAAAPGRWVRTTATEHVESALADLWREVTQVGGPKSRALMSNLIVTGEGVGGTATADELAETSRLHPSRVIVVGHDAAAGDEAEIAIQTHGHGVGQFGVEQITVNAADRNAVPSLLRRFTVGDLPTSICWGGATLPDATAIQHLAPLGRQFIYDSTLWPDPLEAIGRVAPLGSKGGVELDVADLTWRRLKSLRHAIVQAVDPTVLRRPTGHVRAVTVQAHDAWQAMAWLLGGWMASRLGWKPRQRTENASGVTVSFETPDGAAALRIGRTPTDLLRAAIETDALPGAAAIDAVQTRDEIVVRYGWDVPPMTLMAPRRSRPEMLAAELRNLYVDPYLRDALAVVARIQAL